MAAKEGSITDNVCIRGHLQQPSGSLLLRALWQRLVSIQQLRTQSGMSWINRDIIYHNSNNNIIMCIYIHVLQILEVATRKVDFLRSDMISQYKEVE